MERTVVGVDGCSAGWVAVALCGDRCSVRVHASFNEVLEASAGASCIAVDIPLGLVARNWRAADSAAKTFLAQHGRSSSIFAVPPRTVFSATTHADACRLARQSCGNAISIQTFRLFPKILEVDEHVRDERIIEVHPEVSFATMARGRTGLAKKKTWRGAETRRELLVVEGIRLPQGFDGDDTVAIDDVLDAAAAAWSGRRWLLGKSIQFPERSTDVDQSGRSIRIVC